MSAQMSAQSFSVARPFAQAHAITKATTRVWTRDELESPGMLVLQFTLVHTSNIILHSTPLFPVWQRSPKQPPSFFCEMSCYTNHMDQGILTLKNDNYILLKTPLNDIVPP